MLEEHLGPAHVLVRRTLALAAGAPDASVSFLSPLRTVRGQIARGSHLLDRRTLRQLTTFPRSAPGVVIILVDEDGVADRARALREHLSDLSTPPHRVVGVARPELEAWLIADHAAVVRALSFAPDEPPARETLPPRGAKTLLDQWASREAVSSKLAAMEVERRFRMDLARTVQLAVLQRQRSFDDFLRDLRELVRPAPFVSS